MTPTDEQREGRYKNTSLVAQTLYAGEETGGFLRKVFDQYHLRENLYYQYATVFGDVVLSFEEESKLPQLLVERVGLPEKLATIIAHDLLEFINSYKAQYAATAQSAVTAPTPIESPPATPLPEPQHEVVYAPTPTPQPPSETAPPPQAPRQPDPLPLIPRAPEPLREMPQSPVAPPAWSRFVTQGQEAQSTPRAVPANVPTTAPQEPLNIPYAEDLVKKDSVSSDVPSYARPYTTPPPRYQQDPYREKPE